uniref:Selenoprotein O n=1 Tax=Gasterosteus aculeatus aculeatus TaxID=481459 RepID=A0AAQ4P5Y7_GASAC
MFPFRVMLFALVAASSFTPVCVLQFCTDGDGDCHRHDATASSSRPPNTFTSRWNASASNLDRFRVSCKKLIEAFPIDEGGGNYARSVKNCIFSKSTPTPLKGPLRLAAASKVWLQHQQSPSREIVARTSYLHLSRQEVMEDILDLDVAVTRSDDFLLYASGGRLPPGSAPLAHRYGGHQFGYWAGQLGDGRAHSLGQYTNRKGEVWELQLKGSGKTPYSRSGDGRAVIRSSVREFLGSEAMHFLGVPTSRAASLIVSDEPVMRDQFYDGNVKTERGAVVLRLANSWFRIGSLEILSQSGEIDLLRKLLTFVIAEHFPSIHPDDPDKYLAFYSTVVNETAHLIARWTSVGFAHGVCNTDNFSLLSVTLDYGPFGFVESYSPRFVPNTSDDEGRYAIGAQADAALFNLEKLATALGPVLPGKQQSEARDILKGYVDIYHKRTHRLFKAKLGLLGEEEDDGSLIAFLLKMMEETHSDFTMTFRQLSEVSFQQLLNRNFTQLWALEDLSSHNLFPDWLSMYRLRLLRQPNDGDLERQQRMKNENPRYVLRNWMAQSAISKAEKNDFSEVELLHHILSFPFITQEVAEKAGYAQRPPSWAKRLKVSCSS